MLQADTSGQDKDRQAQATSALLQVIDDNPVMDTATDPSVPQSDIASVAAPTESGPGKDAIVPYLKLGQLLERQERYADIIKYLLCFGKSPEFQPLLARAAAATGRYATACELTQAMLSGKDADAVTREKAGAILLQALAGSVKQEGPESITLSQAIAARSHIARGSDKAIAYDTQLGALIIKELEASKDDSLNNIIIGSRQPADLACTREQKRSMNTMLAQAWKDMMAEQSAQTVKDEDKAISALRRLQTLNPPPDIKLTERIAALTDKVVTAHLKTTEELQGQGKLQEALEYCSNLIKQYPESTRLVQVSLTEGRLMAMSGKAAEAAIILTQVATGQDQTAAATAQYELIRLIAKASPAKALAQLDAAIPRLTGDIQPEAYLLAARMHLDQGGRQTGIGYLQRVVQEYPQSPAARQADALLQEFIKGKMEG